MNNSQYRSGQLIVTAYQTGKINEALKGLKIQSCILPHNLLFITMSNFPYFNDRKKNDKIFSTIKRFSKENEYTTFLFLEIDKNLLFKGNLLITFNRLFPGTESNADIIYFATHENIRELKNRLSPIKPSHPLKA